MKPSWNVEKKMMVLTRETDNKHTISFEGENSKAKQEFEVGIYHFGLVDLMNLSQQEIWAKAKEFEISEFKKFRAYKWINEK
jgi:hypothetical protein